MTIEFSNAQPAKTQSTLSITLLVLSCLFFFIPATLVVLGYYSSLPTGTLISPLPQGVLGANPSPPPPQEVTAVPVIASPEIESPASASGSAESNATQKSALLPANQLETTVTDPEILENSQIYLINKTDDKSLYTIKSKSSGQFVLTTNTPSETDRTLEYQVINP